MAIIDRPSSKCPRLLPQGFCVLFVFLVALPALAGDVTLVWEGNDDAAGYKLYYGTAPGAYQSQIDVGNQTTYVVTGLADGEYYFAVTAYNASGEESGYSNEVSTTIPPPNDTTPPTVEITSVPFTFIYYFTDNPLLNLAGTASDAVGIAQVSWSNSRGGSGTAIGTTTWSVSGIPLQLGENDITITAQDAAGNTGTASLTAMYSPVPDTPPTAVIVSPTSSPTYSTRSNALTLAGTASDNFGVTKVTWANSTGGSGIASGTDKWSASGITLQNGPNIITATAFDKAGNKGIATLTVTYAPPDTTAPTVAIISPTSNATYSTKSRTLMLAGTASDDVGVTQVTWASSRGGSGTASGTDNWLVPGITLQSGSNILRVVARDADGNTGVGTLTVNYTPPDTGIDSSTIRINSGEWGESVTDTKGNVWLTDRYYVGGEGTYSGEITGDIAEFGINATGRQGKSGDFSYRIPVRGGAYKITLRFAEPVYSSAGERVFDVIINGQKVLANFDIAATAGYRKVTSRTFAAIATDEGYLDIEFSGVINGGLINGIEVVPSNNGLPSSASLSASSGVMQDGPAGCNHSIAPTEEWFAISGGSGRAELTATAGCGWKVVSKASWLTIMSDTTAAGKSAIEYSVAANPDADQRTASITVLNSLSNEAATLVITQAGTRPHYMRGSVKLETDSKNYGAGSTVMLAKLRLFTGPVNKPVEWRMWIHLPDGTDVPLIQLDELILPPHQMFDLIAGDPIPFLTLASVFPGGEWEICNQLIDSVTGEKIWLDVARFTLLTPGNADVENYRADAVSIQQEIYRLFHLKFLLPESGQHPPISLIGRPKR